MVGQSHKRPQEAVLAPVATRGRPDDSLEAVRKPNTEKCVVFEVSDAASTRLGGHGARIPGRIRPRFLGQPSRTPWFSLAD